MKEALLEGEIRTTQTKGEVRQLRRSGFIPGIVYGKGKPNTSVAVSYPDFRILLREGALGRLIRLRLKDTGSPVEKNVIVKEIQRDHVKGEVIHIDFQEVALTEEITATIPVVLVGEERRKNDGGILEHVLWELEVRALPTALPERIEVDVSGLKIGDSIHVRDLSLPPGVRAITSPEELVALVIAPVKAEEVTPAPETETPVEGEAQG